MATTNAELMHQARETLKGKWGLPIGVCFVYSLIFFVVGGVPGLGGIALLVLAGPLLLGLTIFSLSFSRGQKAEFKDLFNGFDHFGRTLGTFLLMKLYIFLWSLLLIIPGIIKAIGYSQTFLIMADDDKIAYREALNKSQKMMDGYKWKYVYLEARFIGWAILSCLSLGIGFLWLTPYIQISKVKFYDDLKKNIINPL